MRVLFILLFGLLLFGCTQNESSNKNLITVDLSFFEKYAPYCEIRLEQDNPCDLDSCFTSAAVEIVGIDTTEKSQTIIYAWTWVEHFIFKDSLIFSGNKTLSIAKFAMNIISRDFSVVTLFTPDEETPIAEQLREEGFPETLIKTYFVRQPESIEKIRIQALADKAKDKYNLYLQKSYHPVPVDTLQVTD